MQPSYESCWALIVRFSNEWQCGYCDLWLGFGVKQFISAIAYCLFRNSKLVQNIWQPLQSFSFVLTLCRMYANKTYSSFYFSLERLLRWLKLLLTIRFLIKIMPSWPKFTDAQDASLIFFLHSLILSCSCGHRRISIIIF